MFGIAKNLSQKADGRIREHRPWLVLAERTFPHQKEIELPPRTRAIRVWRRRAVLPSPSLPIVCFLLSMLSALRESCFVKFYDSSRESAEHRARRACRLRGPLGLPGWALGRLRLKRPKTGQAAWAAESSNGVNLKGAGELPRSMVREAPGIDAGGREAGSVS